MKYVLRRFTTVHLKKPDFRDLGLCVSHCCIWYAPRKSYWTMDMHEIFIMNKTWSSTSEKRWERGEEWGMILSLCHDYTSCQHSPNYNCNIKFASPLINQSINQSVIFRWLFLYTDCCKAMVWSYIQSKVSYLHQQLKRRHSSLLRHTAAGAIHSGGARGMIIFTGAQSLLYHQSASKSHDSLCDTSYRRQVCLIKYRRRRLPAFIDAIAYRHIPMHIKQLKIILWKRTKRHFICIVYHDKKEPVFKPP